MAWIYCSNCNGENGIDYPSLRARLKGVVECPQCGEFNDISDARDDAIDSLIDRLEAVEAKLKISVEE